MEGSDVWGAYLPDNFAAVHHRKLLRLRLFRDTFGRRTDSHRHRNKKHRVPGWGNCWDARHSHCMWTWSRFWCWRRDTNVALGGRMADLDQNPLVRTRKLKIPFKSLPIQVNKVNTVNSNLPNLVLHIQNGNWWFLLCYLCNKESWLSIMFYRHQLIIA